MSRLLRCSRRAAARVCAVTVVVSSCRGDARADDVPSYCAELRQVAALVLAKDKFASIIGKPREGNFLETTLALPGWADCSFYGPRTYTCNSHRFKTADEGDRALANESSAKSKPAFATAGPRIKAGHRPGYVVLHDDRQVASITINTDRTETRANTSCASSCFCAAGRRSAAWERRR